MNLAFLAQLGEFIGGIAVLATLIYLAAQLRQSARSQQLALDLGRAGATVQAVRGWSGFRRMLSDEQLSGIWCKAVLDEGLRAMVEELTYASLAAWETHRALDNLPAIEVPARVLARELGSARALRQAWRSVAADLRAFGQAEFAAMVEDCLAPPAVRDDGA